MYRIDGKQASDSFTDERAAARYVRLVEQIGGAAARESLLAHTIAGHGVPTLAEWLEHYLTHLTNAHPGTVAEYRRLAARTWLPHLGHLPVDVIGKDAVRAWVGKQARQTTKRGKPTSAKTIANAKHLLAQTFAGAVEAGHRPDNPAHGVALPKGQREEMVILSESEFAILLHRIPEHWRPLVVTLAGTGMRWGEATALQWRDVHLDADQPNLRVTRAWKRGPTTRELGHPKTARSRRTIHLPPEIVEMPRPLRAAPDALVFTGPRGGGVHHQAFHPRVWQPAVAASGIGKRPRIHDLRHTCASWLLDGGATVLEVQNQLGHEKATTTLDVYGHLMAGSAERTTAILSRALTNAVPAIEG
jgi:integrase